MLANYSHSWFLNPSGSQPLVIEDSSVTFLEGCSARRDQEQGGGSGTNSPDSRSPLTWLGDGPSQVRGTSGLAFVKMVTSYYTLFPVPTPGSVLYHTPPGLYHTPPRAVPLQIQRAFPRASPGLIWPEPSPHAEQRAWLPNGAFVASAQTRTIPRPRAGSPPLVLEKLGGSNLSRQTR
jgi:hypothetical protein